MKIFLDANVVIDILTNRNDSKESFLKLLDRHDYSSMYISALSVHILFYVLKIKYSTELYNKVSQFISLVNIIQLHSAHIEGSLNTPYTDYEDLLQFLLADGMCDVIVTRDSKDFLRAKQELSSEIAIVNNLEDIK